jgi:nitronate monooxygenase
MNIPMLRIGNLEINLPIIQGGMGVGISLSGLASAVANEGGIGVISTSGIGMLEPDFRTNLALANERALRHEIRQARKLSHGIIGINVLVALSDYLHLIQVALEEGVDAIFLGAGLPLRFPDNFISTIKTKIIPIVSSARAVKLIFQYWTKHYHRIPDAVVVEGPLAGGHLGFKKEQIDDPAYSLEKIVPEVLATVHTFEDEFQQKIPVIAAGGVFTGEDIYRYMQMGASGVQMATRFVATEECDASTPFKQAYIECRKEDLTIIDSPVGLPGRAIKNHFLEAVKAGQKQPFKCNWACLRTCDFVNAPYCICEALTNAKKGYLSDGFAFAGANAYRINRITTVKDLIQTLLSEYNIAADQRAVLDHVDKSEQKYPQYV